MSKFSPCPKASQRKYENNRKCLKSNKKQEEKKTKQKKINNVAFQVVFIFFPPGLIRGKKSLPSYVLSLPVNTTLEKKTRTVFTPYHLCSKFGFGSIVSFPQCLSI